MKRKQISLKLIYSAQKNGDAKEDFWKHCNGKGNTITLVKTDEDRRFGGFRKVKFDETKKGDGLRDEHAFLFSLDMA